MPASVLVVDDEPMMRELFKNFLSDSYDVRTADGGESAIEALADPVDLVVLDRRMPTMTGDEVAHHIHDQSGETAVVMVSAVDPSVDVLDVPFDDYLTKPAANDELASAVEAGLARRTLGPTEREYARVLAKLGLLEGATDQEAVASLSERRTELRADLGERAARLEARAAAGDLVVNPPSTVDDGM